MKNKNLLNLVGRKSYEQTRKGRNSLDSIVSRFCLVSLICVLMLTIGSGNVWALGDSYTVGAKVTTLVNNDLVVWGYDDSHLATGTISSNWLTISGTKADWQIYKVVKSGDYFYLQKDGTTNYVYSSAVKKMAWNASNKTKISLNSSREGYNVLAPELGGYYYNYNSGSGGIRPYATKGSNSKTYLYKVVASASVSAPTFGVAAGTYNNNQSVTLSCATDGATIYYTSSTNGVAPADPTSSSTAYSSAITVDHDNTIIKAIAIKSGTNSTVASATYRLTCATPTFSPAEGAYVGTQSVTISSATTSANIYYTTNGSTPTTSSTLYSGAITVSSSQTIKALVTKSNYTNSAVGSAAYTITPAYTVTWKNQGSTVTTTNVASGSKPVFPDMSLQSGCGKYTYFYGWAEDVWSGEVSSPGTSSTIKVYKVASEMPNVSGDVTYHAVWSDTQGGYALVESNLGTSWAGDYLIAYSSTVFADGRVGGTGTGGIGKQYVKANPGDNLSGKVVNATWGDTYHVTLEEILDNNDDPTNTYLLKTQDGQYNYQTSNANGLTSTSTRATAANYPITVTFTSSSDVKLGLGGSAAGAVFRYNKSEFFRYYKDGGQNAVYLYKKGASGGKCVTNCCNELGTINGSINMSSSTDGTVTISGWTYNAGSTGTTESNVSSYTVKLYKWNGSAWAIANASSTTGGSSGTAATRTGIATDSKSVTYSGLEYGGTYKFTVQAIGTGSYCDGEETAVTSINGNSLTDNKFLNKYYFRIDDGTQSDTGWENHYLASINASHVGTVNVTLTQDVDYYQYKLTLGGVIWWGNTGKMTSANHSGWTFTTGASNCKLQTSLGGTYTFSATVTTPSVTVTYPTANQASGKKIWFDKSVITGWTDADASQLYWRIGKPSHTTVNSDETANYFSLVPGTDRFYVYETKGYDGFEAWHIANNTAWSGSSDNNPDYDNHGIYTHYHNQSSTDVTRATVYQKYVVGNDGVTLVPTTKKNTDWYCDFWNVDKTDGMLTHNVAVSTAAHGTLLVTYTNTSGTTGQTVTEGNDADLAHRCILTITATPDDGYTCTSLTLNGDAFTSGNTHILTADATIAATFTAQTSTVTLDNNNATSGSSQTVTATYDAAMPLTTTTSAAVAALSRTGYTFNGWWDATSGGTQYYTYSGSPKVIASARTWDKTGAQTLKAQWSINSYTLTWATVRGKITTAGTGAAVDATGNVSSSQEYNTALTAPVCGNANGYTFTGWSPDVADNMPAANTTYTAQWSANVYTVTLDNQSATTAGAASVSATFGQAMPSIASNLPAKTGYRFDGYYTAKNGGGTKYYNADGSSATNMAMYGANPKLYANWVAQITFSVNGVVDDDLTCDVTASLPSSATVPTSCGDCWAFAGWDASSSCSTTPGHAGGEGAATHGITTPTTLYAVFGKAEYQWINSTSELVANDYYVLTNIASSKEYAISNTANPSWSTDASSTEVTDKIRENAAGYILYNPTVNNIWKFTGTKDAGQLQNVGNTSFYLNLTGSGNILSTTDNLTFTLGDHGQWTINSTKYLRHYSANDWDAAASLTEGDFSCYLYHQISAEYATEPSCETYDIVWKVDGTPLASGSQTEETNTCAGIEELPTDPDDDELDCATKFMGWSEFTLIGTGQSAPADLFTDAADAPAINEDKTFHAVFASVDTENTTTVTDNLTCSLTGITGTTYTEWSGKSDNSSAVYAGNSCESSTNKAIQIKSKNSNSGIVTTASGGKAKKITITWSNENTSGKTIDIYGKNSAYSDATDLYSETASTLGTKLGSIVYGTSTEFTITGDYAYIGIRSNDGAAYLSNVAIKWESAAYKDYMTSCCDELVELSTNSPSNGTITFDPVSPIATCDANQNVTMTITPNAGYKLSEWSVATGDGKVAASSTSPAVVTGEDNSDEQEIALTFNQHLSGTYAVSATFEQMHDEYYDYMHDNAKVGANRTGSYSAPSRTSKTAGKTANDCKGNHYKFKGWVVSTEINDDGTLKSGYTLITAGTSMTASNKIYYAVWAEEE